MKLVVWKNNLGPKFYAKVWTVQKTASTKILGKIWIGLNPDFP